MADSYKIAVSWQQKIEGFVVIEAESVEEAMGKVPDHLAEWPFPEGHRPFWGPGSKCTMTDVTDLEVIGEHVEPEPDPEEE